MHIRSQEIPSIIFFLMVLGLTLILSGCGEQPEPAPSLDDIGSLQDSKTDLNPGSLNKNNSGSSDEANTGKPLDDSQSTPTGSSGGTTVVTNAGTESDPDSGGATSLGGTPTPAADPAVAETQSLASQWGFTSVSNVTSDLGDEDFVTVPGSWKPGEAERVNAVLSGLPSAFVREAVGGAPKLYRASAIQSRSRPSDKVGAITSGDGWIALPDHSFSDPRFEHAVIHEFAHGWGLKNEAVEEQWKAQFWQGDYRYKQPPPPPMPPTNYGKGAFFEDFAESVALCLKDPEGFKKSQPERFAFINKEVLKK